MIVFVCVPLHVHADGGAPNLAYVSGTSAGISIIDIGQAKITGTILMPGDPHSIQLSLDGSLLFVTQPAAGRFSIITAKTRRVLCSVSLPGQPSLLALDTNANIVYIAGNGAARVTALRAANCAIQRIFNTSSPVYGLALPASAPGVPNGNSNQLWVAGPQALMVFDVHSGQALDTISIAGGPRFLSIPPPGNMVYATTNQGSVDVVDTRARQVRQVLTGGVYGAMDYDALTGEVYVPDEKHHLLAVLTPIEPGMATLPQEPNRTISLNAAPTSVAITSDGLLGFAALQGGQVVMVDLLNHRIAYTVAVGGTPHFVVTGLYPPSNDTTSLLPPQQKPNTVARLLGYALLVVFLVALTLFILLLLQFRRHTRA